MDVSVTTVLVAAFALVAAIALILGIFIGCAITMNEVGFFAETKEKKDERKEESNT